MKLVSTITVTTLIMASTVTAQAESRADFDEWIQMLAGRWVGQVEWIEDWPGMGNKGDVVTAYFEGEIVLDGNALRTTFFGGDGSESGMIYYDAAAEKIQATVVSTGGTLSEIDIVKRDGTWVYQLTNTLANAETITNESVLSISDAGNTFTWAIDGETAEVWRRVSR